MPKISLDESTLPSFEQRLQGITGDSQRKWGTMSASQVLAHLAQSLKMSLGELEGVEDRSNFLIRPIFKFIVRNFHFARNVKAPRIFFPESSGTLETERAEVLVLMRRFVEESGREPNRRAVSPIMGPTELSFWRLVNGKHLDHHLRQFGV
ncbi:MAG: DUF1569 domain-containing protein [Candidatus Sumerlaeaceae bacterium]|nr:DUF1569 domain-containing protein [Candidatus Sumerlaeaceae bacterium]